MSGRVLLFYCQPSDLPAPVSRVLRPGHDRLGLGGGQPQLDPQQGRR